MKKQRFLVPIALALGLCGALPAADAKIKQQFSAWFSLNDSRPSTPLLGLRYLPTLSLAQAAKSKWKLDSELSLNMFATAAAASWRDPDVSGKIEPYRLWLRLASTRCEARLGLQKINFGSATVLRPLMWFDRIDPRDPLQITAGVYGLLLRYYFKSNANIWLWSLYGNPGTKGWETRATADDTPEFGGRFQAPLFKGEAAATVHFRRLAPGGAGDPRRPLESRFALDGKWDAGVGLWAEAAFVHQDDPAAAFPWQQSIVIGSDYTFKLGRGLYLLAEQFYSRGAPSLFARGGGEVSFSALLARYPLNVLDSLSAILYFDWRRGRLYSFVDGQRTYDHWQFHVILFRNPPQAQIVQAGNGLFAGRGFQLLAVWNI